MIGKPKTNSNLEDGSGIVEKELPTLSKLPNDPIKRAVFGYVSSALGSYVETPVMGHCPVVSRPSPVGIFAASAPITRYSDAVLT
jgi:hypothetical protein